MVENNSHGADVEDISLGVQVGCSVVEFATREALDVIYTVVKTTKNRNIDVNTRENAHHSNLLIN